MTALALHSLGARDRVESFCELAVRGLPKMYVGNGLFVHTVRGIDTRGDRVPRGEGDSLRYAAIVALGLSALSDAQQREILNGRSAADLAIISMDRALLSREAGAMALAAWAAAEVADVYPWALFDILGNMLGRREPMETVTCAWILTAALAATRLGHMSDLIVAATDRLLASQAKSGLFPHVVPQHSQPWGRAHVGCFADQVYPIQALARLYAADHDVGALQAAEACAEVICARQGKAGQWWWHYDTTDGNVIEGYPVYSVHQHAMAPMALLDLWEAGGQGRWSSLIEGLGWIDKHPESTASLVSERDALIWRKIGRREPTKAVRSISAVTTGLKTGWRLPGLDTAFPPDRVDYECRPYELGWLLYAWRSGGVVKALRQGVGGQG